MASDFFRFPHTPHLAWLGAGAPRDDKVLSVIDAHALLNGDVFVEEKLDGANLGFSPCTDGRLRLQNRGTYLQEPFVGQFTRLAPWLAVHGDAMAAALRGTPLMLFGEWCAARHTVSYTGLPDWFVLFDVYDRGQKRFWSSVRRNALAKQLGLAVAPLLARGRMTLPRVCDELLTLKSRFGEERMEGVVIRRESVEWCEARAKLVNAGFTQSIDGHWRQRRLQWNRLALVSA